MPPFPSGRLISGNNLDLFFGVIFYGLYHGKSRLSHHLGEDFWNFFQASWSSKSKIRSEVGYFLQGLALGRVPQIEFPWIFVKMFPLDAVVSFHIILVGSASERASFVGLLLIKVSWVFWISWVRFRMLGCPSKLVKG